MHSVQEKSITDDREYSYDHNTTNTLTQCNILKRATSSASPQAAASAATKSILPKARVRSAAEKGHLLMKRSKGRRSKRTTTGTATEMFMEAAMGTKRRI